jgi:hypothetical protein
MFLNGFIRLRLMKAKRRFVIITGVYKNGNFGKYAGKSCGLF